MQYVQNLHELRRRKPLRMMLRLLLFGRFAVFGLIVGRVMYGRWLPWDAVVGIGSAAFAEWVLRRHHD